MLPRKYGPSQRLPAANADDDGMQPVLDLSRNFKDFSDGFAATNESADCETNVIGGPVAAAATIALRTSRAIGS
jgi:hypothetical protein